jgi:hypothetical protein
MSSHIKSIRNWLVNEQYHEIAEYTLSNRRIFSYLTALTYDQEELIAWRAIEALGIAADALADLDPEYIRSHLRRLMWLLNDESGGIGWRAPEAMGEIIRSRPEIFGEFIPFVIAMLDMEEDAPRFSTGALWAIGRLAQVAPDRMKIVIPKVVSYLPNPDPQVRGLSVWCLGQLDAYDVALRCPGIFSDPAIVQIYKDGSIIPTDIANLAFQLFKSS